MSTYLKCTECDHIELESDIPVVKEWNPDIPGMESFLLCSNCHNKDGGFDTAYPCENCEKREPLIDGTDMCHTCYNAHMSLERDLTALENEAHERANGIN